MRTWKKVSQIAADFYPYAALFRDAREGWASGIAGHMLHTVDGGCTWAGVENRSGASLYRLFWHAGLPHGVGANGVIVRLENGIWQSVPYPDASPAFLGAGVSLHDSQSAVMIGGPSGLLRAVAIGTSDGGRS